MFHKCQGPIVGMRQAAAMMGGKLGTDTTGFVVKFLENAAPLHINKRNQQRMEGESQEGHNPSHHGAVANAPGSFGESRDILACFALPDAFSLDFVELACPATQQLPTVTPG